MSENINPELPLVDSNSKFIDSSIHPVQPLKDALSQCTEPDDQRRLFTHLSTSNNPSIRNAAETLLEEKKFCMPTQTNHLI